MTQKFKVQVTVTLDINLIDTVDKIRGRKSRSAFINDCIAYTLKSDNIPCGDTDLDLFHTNTIKKIKAASKANGYPREV